MTTTLCVSHAPPGLFTTPPPIHVKSVREIKLPPHPEELHALCAAAHWAPTPPKHNAVVPWEPL